MKTFSDRIRTLVNQNPTLARSVLANVVRRALTLTPPGIEYVPWQAMAAIEMRLSNEEQALKNVRALWPKVDSNPAFQECLYALQSFSEFCMTGDADDAVETMESVELAFSYAYGDLLYDPGLLALFPKDT